MNSNCLIFAEIRREAYRLSVALLEAYTWFWKPFEKCPKNIGDFLSNDLKAVVALGNAL
jgi:hypothetical protein